MRAPNHRAGCALAFGLALLAAGCGGADDELQNWMEQQKREVKPTVEPLSPPK